MVARSKTDRGAFAPLYVRYVNPIYRYCYSRLGDGEAAADATSQVFTKVLAALPTCDETSFRAWLFSIAHNVLMDRFRGNRSDQPLEAAAHVPDPALSPEDVAVRSEEHDMLVQLLAQLLPDQRHILELRLAGLTSSEIATVLGRTPNAVDQAQFRALNRLRTLLQNSGLGAEGKR